MIAATRRAVLMLAYVYAAIARAQTGDCPTVRTVNPQATDSGITMALEDHYVWINNCVRTNQKLLVFMPGATQTPGAYQDVQRVAAAAGYHVIGLMYPNGVNLATACAEPDHAPADACFNNARLQILDGLEPTVEPTNVVSVDVPNSINNRLTKLLQYLATRFPEEGWERFLLNGAPKWSQIAVSGHSQGGGEAALIAKLNVTDRVVLFSAVPDTNTGLVSPTAPSWEFGHATPTERYWGLAHHQDPRYAAIATGWDALGMDAFGSPVVPEASGPPYLFTHELVTDLPSSNAHGSTALDAVTPLGPDGTTPALTDAWQYLLTASPEDDQGVAVGGFGGGE
jgi:hypothetical protein